MTSVAFLEVMLYSNVLTNILTGRNRGLTRYVHVGHVVSTGTQCGQPPGGLGFGCLVLVWKVVSMFGLVKGGGRGWVGAWIRQKTS